MNQLFMTNWFKLLKVKLFIRSNKILILSLDQKSYHWVLINVICIQSITLKIPCLKIDKLLRNSRVPSQHCNPSCFSVVKFLDSEKRREFLLHWITDLNFYKWNQNSSSCFFPFQFNSFQCNYSIYHHYQLQHQATTDMLKLCHFLFV